MVEEKYGDDMAVQPNLRAMGLSMLDPDEGDKNDRMGFIRKVYGILAV